jgi:hypothetical protein
VPTPDGDSAGRADGSARGPARLVRAVRALEPEQRIAATAALALWLTMFLPWYGKSVAEFVHSEPQSTGYDLSAFSAFSFVEAAVLLVSAAVLVLLFARAERRAFHLPGGDGLVILAGGVWVSLLIFYRMLDKPGTTGNDRLTTTVGLEWGIFFALGASISLAYAGARIRAAHRPEPALRDDPTVDRRVTARPASSRPAGPRARARSATPPAPGSPAPRPPAPAPTAVARRPPRPASPPFDADAPPTRVIRRVPRFDDLDAEWVSDDRLGFEPDPPTNPRPAPPAAPGTAPPTIPRANPGSDPGDGRR